MPEVRTINGRTLEKHLVRCGVTRAFRVPPRLLLKYALSPYVSAAGNT